MFVSLAAPDIAASLVWRWAQRPRGSRPGSFVCLGFEGVWPLPFNPFGAILQQAEAALHARLSFPAFFTTLTLPDICASIDSDNRRTTPLRYRAWVDTYLPGYDSEGLYGLRCRLLHQGLATVEGEKHHIRYFSSSPATPASTKSS